MEPIARTLRLGEGVPNVAHGHRYEVEGRAVLLVCGPRVGLRLFSVLCQDLMCFMYSAAISIVV